MAISAQKARGSTTTTNSCIKQPVAVLIFVEKTKKMKCHFSIRQIFRFLANTKMIRLYFKIFLSRHFGILKNRFIRNSSRLRWDFLKNKLRYKAVLKEI